jgi:HSP20 family molecular chaperone IbpA
MSFDLFGRPIDRTYFLDNSFPTGFRMPPLKLRPFISLNFPDRTFTDFDNIVESYDDEMTGIMSNRMGFLSAKPFSSIGKCDFVKKDGVYVCELEIERDLIESVKINEKDRIISITIEKTTDKEENEKGYVSKSSSTHSFNRSLQLPHDGVENTAFAKYSRGKLQITVKCSGSEQTHDIFKNNHY